MIETCDIRRRGFLFGAASAALFVPNRTFYLPPRPKLEPIMYSSPTEDLYRDVARGLLQEMTGLTLQWDNGVTLGIVGRRTSIGDVIITSGFADPRFNGVAVVAEIHDETIVRMKS